MELTRSQGSGRRSVRRRALHVALACALCALAPGLADVAGAATGGAPAEAPAGTVSPSPAPAPTLPGPVYAVGTSRLALVDASRRITVRHRRVLRPVTTWLRYPAQGAAGGHDVEGAPAAAGPFPLVVFAHGFDDTPATYSRLLDTWAAAGFVVAAPVFLLGSSEAPQGPDESDLPNQPGDISFVITTLLADSASAASPLHGLINPAEIAVAGQSDGGVAALLSGYGRKLRDRRVRAVVAMSGAEWSGVGGYSFGPGSAPLLAMQGTADTSNEPRFTYAYFRAARRPKYLLRLIGAQHLPPYTHQQPQLSIVENVSTAFLEGYLDGRPEPLSLMGPLASRPALAALTSEP